jgi:hypothetical protein
MELSGDPIWLEAMLRDALGDRLVVHDGWQECGTGAGEHGTGQMGPIWGVLIHHTAGHNSAVRAWSTPSPNFSKPGLDDAPRRRSARARRQSRETPAPANQPECAETR